MNDIRRKYVPPAVGETAFNCPHCGSLAKQFWFGLQAAKLKKDSTPKIITTEQLRELKLDHIEDEEKRELVKSWAERKATGRPFIQPQSGYSDHDLDNVYVSQCFNCDDIAIWIYDRLVWPQRGEAPLPNEDLPDDVRADYDEAGSLLDLSPRGAAALLRLAIEKLCEKLVGKGNLNANIGALVENGLDVRVQQALDIVRVVGNHAVHPGQIDLRDNRATAEQLFALVNLIAESMITQPKHVQSMYDSLPEKAREQIEKRDGKK